MGTTHWIALAIVLAFFGLIALVAIFEWPVGGGPYPSDRETETAGWDYVEEIR